MAPRDSSLAAPMLTGGAGAMAHFVVLLYRKQRAWVDRAELHSSFRSCDSPATPDATDPEAWRPSMGPSGGDVAALP